MSSPGIGMKNFEKLLLDPQLLAKPRQHLCVNKLDLPAIEHRLRSIDFGGTEERDGGDAHPIAIGDTASDAQ